MNKTKEQHNSGFSVIEVLLAASLFGLLVVALTGIYLYGEESSALSGKRNRATSLAVEGLEAVRNIRDADWANLVDGSYGIDSSGGSWALVAAPDTSGVFDRTINIDTMDANHKQVTSTVAWQQNAQRSGSVSLVSKLNYWMQVVASSDWANPLLAAVLDITGNNDGYKLQTKGDYVYMIMNGGSPDFVVIDVSSLSSPSIVGSLSLSGTPQNLYFDSDYVYIASNSNSQELQIIDVSNPASPSVVGTYNAPGNANANGVYVSGNYAYLVRTSSGSDELVVINITLPAVPVVAGSLDLGATGYEVVVSGSYAYIATSSNSQELQVVNVSVPALPVLQSSLNLTSNTNATTIAQYDSTHLLIGQGGDFHTIDISNPLLPNVIGSIDLGSTINDIAIESKTNTSNAFLVTNDNGAEFQVLDVSDMSLPSHYGIYDQPGNNTWYGVAYNPTTDRAFGASSDNSEEFVILEPQ